jgi:hypothetical protein
MPPILHPQTAAFLRDIKERPEDYAPRLGQLRSLALRHCEIREGARALANSPHAAGLRRLVWWGFDMPRGAVMALRKRFGHRFQEK